MSSLSSAIEPSVSPSLTRLVITVLGAGTSTGVPVIGCTCAVCRSSDPRNKRLRPSILVTARFDDGTDTRILIDTTPDLRTQMLRAGVDRVDAVLMTHIHADHIFGMDDLRQFNFLTQKPIPVFGTPDVLDHLRLVFSYCFRETQAGGGKPQLNLVEVAPYTPFTVGGVPILPLTVLHGTLPITAYKFGERFAYVTDVSGIPEPTWPHLTRLDTLILDALRPEPHSTHFGLAQALEVVETVAPRQTYFTHLAHQFDYAETNRSLPPRTALAFDGLTFTVPVEATGDNGK